MERLIHYGNRGIKKTIRNASLAFHSPGNAHETSERGSASKIISQVLHPIDTIKSHKRKASDASKNDIPTLSKKLRAGQGADNAIVIKDDDDDIQERALHDVQATTHDRSRGTGDNLDMQSVLDLFQLSTKKLE